MSKKNKDLILSDLIGGTSTQYAKRCYESHPVIEFPNEGGPSGWLAGGNCSWPAHNDYEVYIGLQYGMYFRSKPQYPWQPQVKSDVIEFEFTISDGHAPKDTENAIKMVDWICNQLQAGKKVHIGCIGGHGRTGMIIAAIIAKHCEIEDAITWVREHYCHKAVESTEQVEWLHKHFGIKKVKGSKTGYKSSHSVHAGGKYPTYKGDGGSYNGQKSFGFTGGGYAGYKGKNEEYVSDGYGGTSEVIRPVGSKRNVWEK